MNLKDWPNCPIPGCKNKICLSLNSKYCWPHTTGFDGRVLNKDVSTDLQKLLDRIAETIHN